MRILSFVLSTALATALVLGGILLLVFAAPPLVEWTVALGVVAVSLLVITPLTLGSMLATWDLRQTEDARRLLRRWVVGTAAVELAAVAAVVAYAVVNASPVWVPALMVGTGAALVVVSALGGPALLRHDLAHRTEAPAFVPVSRERVVRSVVVVAVTFGVALVVCTVAAVILVRTLLGSFDEIGVALALAVWLACSAGCVACVLVTVRLNRTLQEVAGRDAALLTKVAKVVLKRKPDDLDPHERVVAAKYAHIMSITLPFSLATFGFLYAGLVLQQVMQLSSGNSTFAPYVLAFLVVAFVATTPVLLRQIARVRHWAADHAELLRADAQESGVAPGADVTSAPS